MVIIQNTSKWKNSSAIRAKYELKRHSKHWKERKRLNKIKHHIRNEIKHIKENEKRLQTAKQFRDEPAPKVFTFIRNTNEVLKYFDKIDKHLKNKENINLDISEVNELTPDTIALLVSYVNDRGFYTDVGVIKGNAPKKPTLAKLFTESGFYNFVSSRSYNPQGGGNILHKEKHHKVAPQIAKKAALIGIKHTFENDKPYEPLYDILIECMSNTNNHANLGAQGKCYWWLCVYNEPKAKVTSYSFLDLGVGIFESVVIQSYIKRVLRGDILNKNINLVDDLLAGNIQSRVDEDNELRGKGIPQIVGHAQNDSFKEFYLITNDVKVNIKTGKKEQLNYNLNGTFWYWELQPIKQQMG